jgi:hypothetical protein
MRPTWSKFWFEYPDYGTYPDSATVKKDIGGGVDAAYITNTCAVRLSRGLNYSGTPIPANFSGLMKVKGGDGKYYALRVAEMRKWLPQALGTPDVDLTKKKGDAFDKSAIANMSGVIAFDIQFSDATGHLDAWNGSTFSSEYKTSDYWTSATRITLWKF